MKDHNTRRYGVLLIALLCITLRLLAQSPQLPEWMIPYFGKKNVRVLETPLDSSSGRNASSNSFIGTYTGTGQYQGAAVSFNGWSDARRGIFNLITDTLTMTSMVDHEAALVVTTVSTKDQCDAAIMDLAMMRQLRMFTNSRATEGSWTKTLAFMKEGRDLLGHACTAYDGQYDGVTVCRLWVASDIKASPFVDLQQWVLVAPEGLLACLFVPSMMGPPMPLEGKARSWSFTIQEVKTGEQALPKLDLSPCSIKDVRGQKLPEMQWIKQ